MTKIFKNLMIILATLAIAGNATNAYFNDNLTVENNTFSSGTLNIVYSGTASTSLSLCDMEPGTWYGMNDEYKLTLLNDNGNSTIDAKYRIRESLTSETEAGFYNKINVKAYRKQGGNWELKYDGKLKNFEVNPSNTPATGNLDVGETHRWKFEFQLDPTMGNQYQGDNAVFALHVDSTQKSNPGW